MRHSLKNSYKETENETQVKKFLIRFREDFFL